MKSPKAWQNEATRYWEANGREGTIKGATGIGKSFVAIMLMNKLRVSTLIVTPTANLQKQWKQMIIDELDIDEEIEIMYYLDEFEK